jgi:capsular polysaccharide biosynthesis protein
MIMELKEYYKIWRANVSVIVYAILIAVVAAYAWSVRESQNFSSSLLLNVSRIENQSSTDYRYDQFYRLQADDKFSETVSEWLKSPGVVQEIFKRADLNSDGKSIRQLRKTFQAEKMSPEIIEVRFSPKDSDEGKKIADAISSVISEKIKNINVPANDPNWFRIEPSNLITAKNVQDLRINLAISILIGLFAGSLLAFLKHYISEETRS